MSEDQLSCIAPRNPGCQDIIFTHFLNGIRSDNTNKPSPGRYHNRNGNVLESVPQNSYDSNSNDKRRKSNKHITEYSNEMVCFSPAQALKVPTIRPITDKISSTGKLIPMEYLAPYSSLDKVHLPN